MTPLQFLARLCALIPPPRHPLIRFHVFAPHSAWRRAVVSSPAQNPGAETKTTRIESSAHPETPAIEQPGMQDTSKLRSRTGIDWYFVFHKALANVDRTDDYVFTDSNR